MPVVGLPSYSGLSGKPEIRSQPLRILPFQNRKEDKDSSTHADIIRKYIYLLTKDRIRSPAPPFHSHHSFPFCPVNAIDNRVRTESLPGRLYIAVTINICQPLPFILFPGHLSYKQGTSLSLARFLAGVAWPRSVWWYIASTFFSTFSFENFFFLIERADASHRFLLPFY